MKISYNWLLQYIDTDKKPDELSTILTNTGLEVQGVEDWKSVRGGMEKVFTGEVITCKKHPNADKLYLTTVDIGNEDHLSIVCGAPNVRKGQKVIVATVGAVLDYNGDAFEIKKAKIRGENSEGMICAEDELGIGDTHEGILVLPGDTAVGIPAHKYFNVEYDSVIEIDLTPNRIDGASHYGVARDLAAYFNLFKPTRAKLPDIEDFKVDNNSREIQVTIENETDCPRYSGITISNIEVRESPAWLKNRLRSVGLSPLNNIVDITNYVLHEIGQPLHAFDADKISGNRIIVKNLKDNSKFTTLDEVERELSSEDLMICDENGGMCIAGVFGGIGSGVTHNTKNIFIESACFNPVSIRKTARRHDLHTDASFRFERGSDPNITIWALKRAALLIRELAGGEVSSGIIDIYPKEIRGSRVDVKYENINRLTGKPLDRKDIKKILDSLDIIMTENDMDGFTCEIPTYRVDVTREADVIEEILRIYGYNNIEIPNKVNSTLSFYDKPNKERVINTLSDMLSGSGFTEIMSNSLNPSAWYRESADFNNDEIVMISNPLSSDLDCMRQSLLFGGLNAISRNINRQNPDLKLYEFGSSYFLKPGSTEAVSVSNYREKLDLDLFITGNKDPENWNIEANKTDFFTIKSFIELILNKAGINTISLSLEENKQDYYSIGLEYLLNKSSLAHFGKIDTGLLLKHDIKQDVYYGHIEFDILLNELKRQKIKFRSMPKHPYVRRDLALLINKDVSFEQIRKLAYDTERILLRQVGLFDVYESDSLGKGKKSYAVSFILQDYKRTLTDKIIDKTMKKLVNRFEKELGAQIR